MRKYILFFRRRAIVGLWGFCFSGSLIAVQQELPCQAVQSAEELLTCAAMNELETLEHQAAAQAAALLPEIASQHPNPDFESELWHRETEGKTVYEATVSWLHPVLRGGKLEAKKAVAKAQKGLAELRWRRSVQESQRHLLLNLYRLVRLEHEIDDLNEMIESYDRIIKVYRGRQALSPEARISVQVFEIARQEAKARLHTKRDERAEGLSSFENLGIPRRLFQKVLPKKWPQWPQLSANSSPQMDEALVMELNEANVTLYEAELQVEKSQSYQDIKLGPMASLEQADNRQKWALGVAFSMNLPVYQQNAAGINYAAAKLNGQKNLSQRWQWQLQRQYQTLLHRYQQLRREIDELPTDDWLRQAHQQLETEAHKGRIDASLTIEGHAQHLAIIERRNELALRLLEALAGIYLLEGKPLTEILP